jgi:cation transport ATPase
MKTEKLRVTGMTCAACQANVEKVTRKLNGVDKSEVNLLAEQLTVVFDENKLTTDDIINAVNSIGYGASLNTQHEKKSNTATQWDERKKNEAEKLKSMKVRLISSIVFLVILMYIAMGHMLFLPLPSVLHGTENAS